MSKYSSWGERELIAELEKRDSKKTKDTPQIQPELFYVVESINTNEEIFLTKDEATNYFNTLSFDDKPRIYVAVVKGAYYDEQAQAWNYNDFNDTFTKIASV